jgi:hypothetical protein
MSKVANIAVGDHIASINGQDLTGCRHFEVARMLKEIPIGSEFVLGAVSPKTGMQVGQRTAIAAGSAKEVKAGEGRKTLRMKKDGTAVVEEEATGVKAEHIQKIDEMLEGFVGIRDLELSTTMYGLAKDAKDAEAFAGSLDVQLSDFLFPDDFVLDVFELVHPSK